MKIKTFLVSSVALLAAVSCGQKASDVTKLTGEFPEGTAPSSVVVAVPGQEEVTADVVDGKFSMEVPADITAMSTLTGDNGVKVKFVSDGTPLEVSFEDAQNVKFTSKAPKASVQARVEAFKEGSAAFVERFRQMSEDLSEEQADSLYDAINVEYLDFNRNTFKENTGNVLSLVALQNLQYDIPVAELNDMIEFLDPSLAATAPVESMKKVISAKLATDEGCKFTDFEVGGTKFSSYVGNGKYVLVDFWASWCGPCKGEIPNVKNIYQKYAGEDFDVLSVAVWDKPQATVDTAAVYGITWNQIIDAQQIPTDIYGIQGIPHIILFGPDGTILKRDLRGKAIEEEIAKYVQPKN